MFANQTRSDRWGVSRQQIGQWLPAFGPFAGGLNLRGAAFEPLSGGADRSAPVLSQAEIDAVPNERCLPD